MIKITLFDDDSEFYSALDKEEYKKTYSCIDTKDKTQGCQKTVFCAVENVDFDQLCNYMQGKPTFGSFVAYQIDSPKRKIFIEIA